MPTRAVSPRRFLLLLCLGVLLLPLPLDAQDARRVDLDIGLGLRRGSGGTYRERSGFTIDAILAPAPIGASALGIVPALAVGVQSPLSLGLGCAFSFMGDEGTSCGDEFPGFLSLATLIGITPLKSGPISARVLAGPALFRVFLGEPGGEHVGVVARLDVTIRHAVGAWARTEMFGGVNGETLRVTSFGIGARVP